jgi:hypothetical protein
MALKMTSARAAIRVCHPTIISRPPPVSRIAVRTARMFGYGRPFEPIAEAVAPRSMNFSMPELTKISTMRIRPIARIESLTPAAARTFARTGLPLIVVVVIGSLPG